MTAMVLLLRHCAPGLVYKSNSKTVLVLGILIGAFRVAVAAHCCNHRLLLLDNMVIILLFPP